MIVYVYTFPNGKKYVGQTIFSIEKRAGENGKNYQGSPILYRAIQKYGWDNIKKESFSCASKEDMDALEIELIKKYKTQDRNYGYNILPGGNSHREFSPATIKKLQEIRAGEGNGMYGKTHSEESKEKMSKNRPESKAVICLETKKVYASSTLAAKDIGLKYGASIRKVCNKLPKFQTAGGYHWAWLKDYNESKEEM